MTRLPEPATRHYTHPLVFLLLEEILAGYTIHWQFGLGALLLLVVLAAPNGLMSLAQRRHTGEGKK